MWHGNLHFQVETNASTSTDFLFVWEVPRRVPHSPRTEVIKAPGVVVLLTLEVTVLLLLGVAQQGMAMARSRGTNGPTKILK